jgi:glutamate--cysteine ligase
MFKFCCDIQQKEFSERFDKLLSQLDKKSAMSSLTGIKRGIEKESLRVGLDGYLSQKDHPKSLGATLTHPYITTDYSEALLELITPPSSDPEEPIKFLHKIHQFVNQNIGDEFLWNASMPCMMTQEKDIPIAKFGSSNVGKQKYIYRVGLGKRYGKLMQTIAGVHYNFSLPDEFWQQLQQVENNSDDFQEYKSARYMGLIRNFLRYSWMLPFLFGASPGICRSFVKGKHNLESFNEGTLYGPYATSLRMGDMGYSNNAQSRLNISYNSLEAYTCGLEKAIRTPEPLYQEIGVKVDGEYQQLSTSLLQIENEYYANIRPKRVARSGERPALALRRGGVEYIEVRGLDINPFTPDGITNEQMRWLDSFLVTCLLLPSPEITTREEGEIRENLRRTVNRGRQKDLTLVSMNREISLAEAGHVISEKMMLVAKHMDNNWNFKGYTQSVSHWQKCFDDPERTLSAQFLQIMREKGGYYQAVRELSLAQKESLLAEPLDQATLELFKTSAQDSLQKQLQLEQQPQQDFEEFIEKYYQ